MPVLSRVLGVSTIAFGALEFAKPDLWAKPTGITGPSPAMRTWHQTLGARDVVSGLAMALAPAGPALRAATLFRIVSDSHRRAGLRPQRPGRPAQGQGRRRGPRLRRAQRPLPALGRPVTAAALPGRPPPSSGPASPG